MADAPKIPRNTPSRKPTMKAAPSSRSQSLPDCYSKGGCPFASLRSFIDWMNVVDEFKLAGHLNYIPRWGFLMLVLVYLAVN